MEEKKKISNKTATIIVITIIILAILYFLFFVVDIISYVKNYDYLQDAGQRADELKSEFNETSNNIDRHYNEYLNTKNELESFLEN